MMELRSDETLLRLAPPVSRQHDPRTITLRRCLIPRLRQTPVRPSLHPSPSPYISDVIPTGQYREAAFWPAEMAI